MNSRSRAKYKKAPQINQKLFNELLSRNLSIKSEIKKKTFPGENSSVSKRSNQTSSKTKNNSQKESHKKYNSATNFDKIINNDICTCEQENLILKQKIIELQKENQRLKNEINLFRQQKNIKINNFLDQPKKFDEFFYFNSFDKNKNKMNNSLTTRHNIAFVNESTNINKEKNSFNDYYFINDGRKSTSPNQTVNKRGTSTSSPKSYITIINSFNKPLSYCTIESNTTTNSPHKNRRNGSFINQNVYQKTQSFIPTSYKTKKKQEVIKANRIVQTVPNIISNNNCINSGYIKDNNGLNFRLNNIFYRTKTLLENYNTLLNIKFKNI